MILADRRECPRSLGFTLLEIVVVLVIVAIIAGATIPTITNRMTESQLRQEASRLRDLLLLASDYSLIHQQVLGVVVKDDRYQFVKLDEKTGRWKETGLTNFGEQVLPSGLSLEASSARTSGFLQTMNQGPAILIYPDGHIAAFSATFHATDKPSATTVLRLSKDGLLTFADGSQP